MTPAAAICTPRLAGKDLHAQVQEGPGNSGEHNKGDQMFFGRLHGEPPRGVRWLTLETLTVP